MALCKSKQIQNCCHPNALMTLKEFLTDYASEDAETDHLFTNLLTFPGRNNHPRIRNGNTNQSAKFCKNFIADPIVKDVRINIVRTLKEFLTDYASEETKKIGEALIAATEVLEAPLTCETPRRITVSRTC